MDRSGRLRMSVMLLSLFFIVGLTALVSKADKKTVGDYEIRVIEDGDKSYCEITKYKGTESSLTIPAELDGYPVYSLGYAAFSNNANLTAVKISEGIKSINYYCFSRCPNLTKVEISSSVEDIYFEAFEDTPFYDSFEGDFIIIGDFLYEYKGHGSKIVVPDGVKRINPETFCCIYDATEIVIPDSVTFIGGAAFAENALQKITLSKNIKTITGRLFYAADELKEVEIPDGVTEIEYEAFAQCQSLERVVIPASVKDISSDSFAGASKLKEVIFKGTEEDWKKFTDSGLVLPENVNVKTADDMTPTPTEIPTATPTQAATENPVPTKAATETPVPTATATPAVSEAVTVTVTPVPTAPEATPTETPVVSPEGKPSETPVPAVDVTAAAAVSVTPEPAVSAVPSAPAGKTKAVAGGSKYKIIKGGVEFTGSSKKGSIKIPASVKIGGKVYKVIAVGKSALAGRKDITSVSIGKNVAKIGKNAFKNCKKLKTFTVKSVKIKSVAASAFKGCPKKMTFKISKAKKKVFAKALKGKKIKYKKI